MTKISIAFKDLPPHIRRQLEAERPIKTEIQRTIERAKREALEQALLTLLRQEHMPEPETQYRFAPGRKWAADFAYPDLRILIEVEGGTKGKSRHTTHEGYQEDCRKYNTAATLGFVVLRFTDDMISNGEAVAAIRRARAVQRREQQDAER